MAFFLGVGLWSLPQVCLGMLWGREDVVHWAREAAWTDTDVQGLMGTPALTDIEKSKASMGLFLSRSLP